MKINKGKAVLGTLGATTVATGGGLYIDQAVNNKSHELTLQIEQLQEELEEKEEQLIRETLINNKINDNLHDVINSFIKDPDVLNALIEQKNEILSLREETAKLKRQIIGYEDLLFDIENKVVNEKKLPSFIFDEVKSQGEKVPLTIELKAKVQELEKQLEDLKNDYEELLDQPGECPDDNLMDKLEKENARFKKLLQEIDGENHKEADRMTEEWVYTLEAKVNDYLKQIEELKSKNKELEAYTVKLETYRDAIEDYIDKKVSGEIKTRDEIIDYKNKITEGLNEELQEKEALIENKDSLIIKLGKDIDDLLNQIKHLERTETNLQGYIDALHVENDKLRQDYEQAEKFKKALVEQVNKLLFEKKRLIGKQSQLQNEVNTVQSLANDLADEVKDLTDKVKDLEFENETLSDLYQAMSNDNAILEEKIAQCKLKASLLDVCSGET